MLHAHTIGVLVERGACCCASVRRPHGGRPPHGDLHRVTRWDLLSTPVAMTVHCCMTVYCLLTADVGAGLHAVPCTTFVNPQLLIHL